MPPLGDMMSIPGLRSWQRSQGGQRLEENGSARRESRADPFAFHHPMKVRLMIYVIATVEVGEGQRDAFLAEFRKVMPLVQAECGCLEYGPTIDIETGIPVQIAQRPNVVTIVERWESVDALKAHLVAPHMHDYRARVKDLVKGVKLQVTEPTA